MAQAPRDNNRIPAMLVISNADGTTPIPLYANPSTHRLIIAAAGGTVNARTDARRDENRITTLLAVSSSDGITPVTLMADATSHGLIKGT